MHNGELTHIKIDDGGPDVYVCNNCGANAVEINNIQHHDTCTPGESKRWEEFYNKINEDEEAGFSFQYRKQHT